MKRKERLSRYPKVQKTFTKEPTFIEKVGIFIKFIVLLSILVLPFFVFLLPNYWQNFLVAPKLYSSAIVFFFIPICIILARPIWKCPFFLAPFSISFVLSSQTTDYLTFLFIYWFYIGSVLTAFAPARTIPPYRSLELKLFLTDYFIDYFEVRYYWRTIILLLAPVFVPSAFFLFNFF